MTDHNAPRRAGHSKLVYDKETRTIVTVDPHSQDAPRGEAMTQPVCPTCGKDDCRSFKYRMDDEVERLIAALTERSIKEGYGHDELLDAVAKRLRAGRGKAGKR
jgi:hypothetical protein